MAALLGQQLIFDMNCSSASYKFQVDAYVNVKGGSLSGNFTEVTRNVTGTISGRASGGQISIGVSAGSAFSAHMSLITSGGGQSVEIKPKGTDVTDVSVRLSKGR